MYSPHERSNEADELVSQTSFMGLPTELRLSIYPYLVHFSDQPTVTSHNVWPAILAVNRQVFDEAMPIFYSKVRLQIEAEEGRRLEEALCSLPPYSLEHIADICLVPKRPRWPSSRYWFDSSLGFTRDDWDCLRIKVPKLKTLRVQIQVAKGDLSHIRWSVFEYLATLPKLETVEVVVFSDRRFIVSAAELVKLAEKLVERVNRRAVMLDRRMTVRALVAPEGAWRVVGS